MTLGEKIAQYRVENDISLRAFARVADLSPTYISYLEKGQTQRGITPIPTIITYQKCAKAMGLDVDELIRQLKDVVAINTKEKTVPSIEDGLSDIQRELVHIIKTLPEEDCALLLAAFQSRKAQQ